jgi:hypothetical protein
MAVETPDDDAEGVDFFELTDSDRGIQRIL